MTFNGRLAGLDGLRGLLALSVATGHAFGHLTGWKNQYSPFGNTSFAVDIFFVLSGIVLYHAYRAKFANSRYPGLQFLAARWLRLWPTHIFTIALIFGTFLVTTGALLPNWIAVADDPTGIFLDTALLSSVGIFGQHGAVNGPSWSISVEMWIGTAIMLILIRAWWLSIPLVLAASSVFILEGLFTRGGGAPIYLDLSAGAWRCMLGMGVGVLSYKMATWVYSRASTHTLNLIAGLGLTTALAVVVSYKPHGLTWLAITVCVGLSLTAIPLSKGWVVGLLEAPPIRRLGELSFSLYLIHTPIIFMAFTFKSDRLIVNMVLVYVVLAVSILAAAYCNKNVENRFSYRWKYRRRTPSRVKESRRPSTNLEQP